MLWERVCAEVWGGKAEEETAEAALEAGDGGDPELQAAGEVAGFGDAIAEERESPQAGNSPRAAEQDHRGAGLDLLESHLFHF